MKKAAIVVLMSALVSTNALAWGDREQGILAGMAALWAFQKLNQADAAPPQPVYVRPQPVYVDRPVVEYQRQQCSPWIETRNWDGTVTRSRTCNY
jgi:hypothetical protein